MATQKMLWISVNDRLPQTGFIVLCVGEKGGMFFGRNPWRKRDGKVVFESYQNVKGRVATHWMYLPEPPGGES